MTYSLPEHNTDCLLVTQQTEKHLVVTLHHAGLDLDRFYYARTKDTVKVPGAYSQDETGACQHASYYWFVRPPYTRSK